MRDKNGVGLGFTAGPLEDDPTGTPGCALTDGKGIQVWTGGTVDGVVGWIPLLQMGPKDERGY